MARLSKHERGLAVSRLQAGQSVSQVRPLFAMFILHLRLYSFVCYFFESADFKKNLHGYLNMVLSKVLQISNQ